SRRLAEEARSLDESQNPTSRPQSAPAERGFVRLGQPAVVKVEAFPFTRYGTIDGKVTRISADAVDMRNAPNLSEAAATVRPQGASSSSSANRPEMAFAATIAL